MWEWMGLTGYGLRSMPEAAPYQTTRHKKRPLKMATFFFEKFAQHSSGPNSLFRLT